ncbi:hypothetical protein EWB00_002855 [Schistosoma japonicum]|uniref:Uncharacterized protein n=1 Tax=Schistosoma japonicum TaxID=6182 RepID=A0A4Z2DAL6_SCHJA|nr:hypothetical protein EWB00_002855 [Schistosoma japonicum]
MNSASSVNRMLTFLQSFNKRIYVNYIICWTAIVLHLVYLMNFHLVISYQKDVLIENIPNSARLKRVAAYSNSDLDNPNTSSMMNIFYRIRADRKGLITCEVNSEEIDSTDVKTNTLNQTQFGNVPATEIKPASTLYLICPQLSTSICYMDCSPNCVLNENGCTIPRSISQVIEGCQFKRISSNTFHYQYIINMEKLDHTGLWNCEYRGQRAVRSLELQAAEPLLTVLNETNQHKTNSKTVNSSTKQNSTGVINQLHRNTTKLFKLKEINSTATESQLNDIRQFMNDLKKPNVDIKYQNNLMNSSEAWKNNTLNKMQFRLIQKQENHRLIEFKLTRPELVLSLIGILAISLIVNIILIIRCLLLKSYLDDSRHGKMSSRLKCLLCLQLKSNLNMSTLMENSCNQSNHKPLLMTSCHVGQLIEPNKTFMNYSTQFDDSLTDSVLLYHNKSGHYAHNESNHLLPVNTSIMLPNLFQTTTSIVPLTTKGTNVSSITTNPDFNQQLNKNSTINPHELLKFHGQNGQSSSGVSLESDPIPTKRTNLFHSQSVNYSRHSNHHPLLSECCFQNGSITIAGQNGSLNGSLLYSNDSTSLTDTTNGNGVFIPSHVIVSQNPYSPYRMQYICQGEQSEKLIKKSDFHQQQPQFTHLNDYVRSPYQQISSQIFHQEHQHLLNTEQPNSDANGNDESCNLIPEKPNNQDLQVYSFGNSSTIDSLSHGTNNSASHVEDSLTLHSNQLPSCLTPLVVRFPSGESGFLFCPTRATNENYQSESLSRRPDHISIVSNLMFKSMSKDKRSNSSITSPDIKLNSDDLQTNVEAVMLDNLIQSNQISQDSQNNTKVIFLPDNHKSQNSTSGNIHELIVTSTNEHHLNHVKLNASQNSNISSVDCETSFKSAFSQCINNNDSRHTETNSIHTPLQKAEFVQFTDSSNGILHGKTGVQELNINSTISPVR